MSNLNDTEIQRLFEEAEEKANTWDMPDDTRRASTESITTEFLELLAEEEKAGAKDESIPKTSTSEADESKPSDEKKMRKINLHRNRVKS